MALSPLFCVPQTSCRAAANSSLRTRLRTRNRSLGLCYTTFYFLVLFFFLRQFRKEDWLGTSVLSLRHAIGGISPQDGDLTGFFGQHQAREWPPSESVARKSNSIPRESKQHVNQSSMDLVLFSFNLIFSASHREPVTVSVF